MFIPSSTNASLGIQTPQQGTPQQVQPQGIASMIPLSYVAAHPIADPF